MPYIEKERRAEIIGDEFLKGVAPKTAGELNFLVTMICLQYIQPYKQPESYAKYNEVVGALECAKLELYRRKVAVYEDYKRSANGDVY